MSFDLYFVEPPADDETWTDVMNRREQATNEPSALSAADVATWERIVAAVRPIVGDVELFGDGHRFRELDVERIGLQLTMFPGELALSVPYWFEGDEAAAVDRILRDVAAAVERESRLVAYDPQSDRAFLDAPDGSAAATMDHTIDRMRAVGLGQRSTPPPPPPARPPWWQRLFGR